jgi:DNA-binding transcriptional LysR family regulator
VALVSRAIVEDSLRSGALVVPVNLAASTIDNHYLAINPREGGAQVAHHFADWLRNELSPKS